MLADGEPHGGEHQQNGSGEAAAGEDRGQRVEAASPGERAGGGAYGSTLPIREPLDEYTAAIDGLYEWMFTQCVQLDVADIEAASALIDEYNDVLTGRREWVDLLSG